MWHAWAVVVANLRVLTGVQKCSTDDFQMFWVTMLPKACHACFVDWKMLPTGCTALHGSWLS